MASNLFKRLWIPNADGSDSTIPCTDENTAFVHSYAGDDSTGNGTRNDPFKSRGRAEMKAGVSYINFRGVINEYFSSFFIPTIGDDINQVIVSENFNPLATITSNLTIDKLSGAWNHELIHSIITSIYTPFYTGVCKFSFFKRGVVNGQAMFNSENATIVGFQNSGMSIDMKNGIISKEFDICNLNLFKLQNVLLLSDTIFKYNGVQISSPNWSNDSIANIQLLRDAYLANGVSQNEVDKMFHIDSFGNETCKIIWEQKDGGTHPNIFNRYNVDGTVADFSLNPNPLNEALHASDIGSSVGCFPAAIAANNWGSVINVNADGSDDVVAGQLLQPDFTFSHASGQTWNRVRGDVEKIEKPGIFKGLNCDTNDGTPWGDYFGKKQNLVSNVALNTTDALEPNTRYKVSNTADHSNYAIVIYKGVQYPPDFFFVTDDTILSFELLNADSGSIVRKVFAIPLESGEIIVYDNYTTPSAFPRFSAPFMGVCLMLFHKIGVNIDQPVLFSEVDNDKMAYYTNWAVTNADQEFVTLAPDTVNYYYKIPVLTYFQRELNAHFDANYDQ